MDLHGSNHRSNECKLDHECDQEIQEASQKVHRQVNHRKNNGYEPDHDSGQVGRQANQEQNYRSELVHGLDEIQPRESNGDEESHGSSQMNVQEISVNGHDRGKVLHGRIDTASVVVISDAEDTDLPVEEPSLPRTSTLFPKDASTLNTWSMVTREVAGDPCIFILHCLRPRTDTILVERISSDEIQKRRARSLRATGSPQGDISTYKYCPSSLSYTLGSSHCSSNLYCCNFPTNSHVFAARALINFDIDLVVVPEEILDLRRQIEHWDKIQKLCVIIYNVSNNRVSPLTMQRLNQLTTLRKVMNAYSWNSERAQYPLHEVELRRYAQAIQKDLALRKSFPHIHWVLVEPHDGGFFGRWYGPTQRVSILLSVLVTLTLVAAALAMLCLFKIMVFNLPNRDGEHEKN